MQCGVEERVVRRQEVAGVECFKCGEKGHKCRKCPMWRKAEKRGVEKATYVAKPQKAQQKKLKRVEEEEAVHVTKPQEAQQWKRSPVHIL